MSRSRTRALPKEPPPTHGLFAGEPPASWRRGLEPAFLLLDSELMALLCTKSAAMGTTYDLLLRAILRDHIHEY